MPIALASSPRKAALVKPTSLAGVRILPPAGKQPGPRIVRREPLRSRPRTLAATSVARRPGKEQGMALECLGHAVEYLIDSRMFLTEMPYTRSDEEALQILMSASRAVFEDCPVIVPWTSRVKGWLLRSLIGTSR